MKISSSHKYLEILYNLYSDGIDTRLKTERYLISHGYSWITKKEDAILSGRPKSQVDIEDTIYRNGEHVITKEVTTKEWKPESITDHTPTFYDWISSMNIGFDKIRGYDKYSLYIEQVNNWMADNSSLTDFNNTDDKISYLINERRRMRDNSLYYLEKYHYIKDASQIGGKLKYKSDRAQRIICFLIDSGYSFFLAKPRQMWATTTLYGIFQGKAMYNKSIQIYLISANEKKAQDSLRDKLKSNVYMMNTNLRPAITTDAQSYISFYEGEKYGGLGSRVAVGATTNTSVNSTTPEIIGVDEAGLIMNLGEIISEIRPTLKKYNPETGKQELKGQLIIWGTAGNVDGGGGAFKMEFEALMKLWEERDFSANIIPVMFNFWARPGMTQQEYDREYKVAYSYEGEGKEEKRRIFHQSYPKTKDDLFMTSSDTIIPRDEINNHIIRIRENKMPIMYGYFNPNVNMSKMTSNKNDEVGYQITGTQNFIPVEDPSSRGAVWWIFKHPEKGWKNRYYQGTDPIKGISGKSKFATAIGDNLELFDENNQKLKEKEVVAVMNYRTGDYRFIFLQALLGGLYYDIDIQNLIEINDGDGYKDYCMDKGYGSTIMTNLELPMALRVNSANPFGINKRGTQVPQTLMNKLQETLLLYPKGINDVRFWLQLQTFTRLTTQSGYVKYKPKDIKTNYDDIIDAITYLYINMEIHDDVKPLNINAEINKPSGKMKFLCDASTGWSPRLVPENPYGESQRIMGYNTNFQKNSSSK